MIIETMLGMAAASSSSMSITSFIAWITGTAITSFAAGGVGTHIYHKMKEGDAGDGNAQQLEALQLEREQHKLTAQKNVSELVQQTQVGAANLMLLTTQQQSQIAMDTRQLTQSTQMMEKINPQLLDVTTLLRLVSESTTKEVQPVIDELRRRLNEFSDTALVLNKTTAALKQLEQSLQNTIKQHAVTQEKLAEKVKQSQLKIDELSSELLTGATMLINRDENDMSAEQLASARANISRLTTKISELESSLYESSSKLIESIQVNRHLEAENNSLHQTIRLLSGANDAVAEVRPATLRSNGLTMF